MPAETDKKLDSINALKNANKHLADIFNDLAKKDLTLKTCADDLQRAAAQCGDLKVVVWVANTQKDVSLKQYLGTIANTLNEAR
jgi:hypothetical protein